MQDAASVLTDRFSEVLERLPAGLDLDVLALEAKAIQRRREVVDGAALLRIALARGPGGLSLRQTAAWASMQRIAQLSNPGVKYRLEQATEFLAVLVERLLAAKIPGAALVGWAAPKRSTPGGQPVYSDLAIELVLTLRLLFHLALRQAEAFARSVLKLLGLELRVPDHSTLSRRGPAFAGRQPRCHITTAPMHLVLDSTGLELFGQGGWDAAKHGRARRQWLKLHVAVDTDTGEIAAHLLTDGTADDAAQVPHLLRQTEGIIASVIADGAYDGEAVYQAAAARQPGPSPDVVIPPRASAVRSTADPDGQTPRDRQIRLVEPRGSPDMAERGRIGWQRATGYGRRNLAETAIGRYKHLIGPKLRARTYAGQQGEAALAVQVLNRMIREAKPVTIRHH